MRKVSLKPDFFKYLNAMLVGASLSFTFMVMPFWRWAMCLLTGLALGYFVVPRLWGPTKKSKGARKK